jgi:hypothetical protein
MDPKNGEGEEFVSDPTLQTSSIWSIHKSEGRIYYYNEETKKSTWTKPFELLTKEEQKLMVLFLFLLSF